MITFFRRIRRGLLKENKVSSYLLYGIGEILLVVIGILLALQINTWNQNRINKTTEKKYLTNLVRVLESDTLLMDRVVLSRFERKMEGLNLVKQYIRGNYEVKDTMDFLLKVSYGAVFGTGTGFLNNSAFDGLVSTGNLQLIENEDLKQKINYFYARVEDMKFVTQKYVSNYLTLMNSMKPFDSLNPDFISIDDQKFMMEKLKSEKVLLETNREITAGIRTKNGVTRLKAYAAELMDLIKAEINQ